MQPCRILLQGSTLHLLHADYLDPLLRAAGFSWDQSGKAYVKRAIDVACMVEAASVLDITAQAVVEAVQSAASQTQRKGAGWPSFQALRVSVDDNMVHVSGPPGIMEHARSMGFQPVHQSALKLGVRQVAINNEKNNEMNKEREHEREFKLGVGQLAMDCMDNEMSTAINNGMNAVNNERAHQRAMTLGVGQVELKMGVRQVAQLMAADLHTAFRHASSSLSLSSSSLSSSSLSSASISPPPDGDAAEPRANRKSDPEQSIQAADTEKNAPAAQDTDIKAADIKAADTGKSTSGAQDAGPEQDIEAEGTDKNARATCDARDDDKILLQHVTPQAVVALIQRSIETLAEKLARGSSAPSSKPQIRIQNDEVQVLNAYDVKDMLRSLGFTWNTESACWRMDAMQLLERMQAHELSAITIDDILALEPGTSARLEISDGEVLVYNSYAIKDKLRALDFRFDSERRAWVRSVFEVTQLLELEDHADITLDQILAHPESTAFPSELSSAGELRKPHITCDDDQVCVFDSYDVKDKLKALSFRFDSARAVWTRPTAEVLSLLALDDKTDISIQRLFECSPPEVGATDEDGAAGASLEIINDEVLIYNSYAIKDKLRALDFRFDSERRAWVRSVFEVKRLLEVTDHADITLEQILALSESMVPILSSSSLSLSEGQRHPVTAASGSDGSPPPIGPELQVDGGNVTVRRCYDIKDQLRSRGFRWDAAGRVWSRTTSEVLLLLGVTDSSQITLKAVLQANETQRGGASPPTAASMPQNIFSTENTFSTFGASSPTNASSPDLELFVAAVEEQEAHAAAQNTFSSQNTFSTIAAQGRVADNDHFSPGAQEESNEGQEGEGGAGGRKREKEDAKRETPALEGDENCSIPTAALLAKGAEYGEGKSTDGVGGRGGGVSRVPNLCVEGELVIVARCYAIKDQLRMRGFRWDAANRY